MEQFLYKYLMQNGILGIPALGVFSVTRYPAEMNKKGTTVFPPREEVAFQAGNTEADRKLFDFLATEMHVDQVAAIQAFQSFVNTLKIRLDARQSPRIQGIGSLDLRSDGTPYLLVADIVNSYVEPIELPKGVSYHQQIVNAVPTADKNWLLYALILFVLAIAAIAFQYFQSH